MRGHKQVEKQWSVEKCRELSLWMADGSNMRIEIEKTILLFLNLKIELTQKLV